MKLNLSLTQLARAFCLVLVLMAGCGKVPSAPARNEAITVTVSRLETIHPSFLGATQNEILYHLDGPGDPPGHGVYGPFTTALASGSVSFSLKISSNPGPQLLSLQLNDAATHQPLAIGAVPFDLSKGISGGLVVDMGSVTRNCYFPDESRNPAPASNPYCASGSSYSFGTDALVVGVFPGEDVFFDPSSGQFTMLEDGSPVLTPNSMAYMGNGELVDFDGVPPASRFYAFSYAAKAAAGAPVTTLQAGDIYCVRLASSPGGHAWIQITDPGVVNNTGPSFRFRVNSKLSYFGYEQNTADLGGNCSSGW